MPFETSPGSRSVTNLKDPCVSPHWSCPSSCPNASFLLNAGTKGGRQHTCMISGCQGVEIPTSGPHPHIMSPGTRPVRILTCLPGKSAACQAGKLRMVDACSGSPFMALFCPVFSRLWRRTGIRTGILSQFQGPDRGRQSRCSRDLAEGILRLYTATTSQLILGCLVISLLQCWDFRMLAAALLLLSYTCGPGLGSSGHTLDGYLKGQ